ncbi:MAG: creatininase family protein [Opitutaceae bacterium]
MTAPASPPSNTPPLCVADDTTFWPWFSSPALGAWPGLEDTVVVVPLAGLSDWGLGHPLDAEETVLMHLIRGASLLAPEGRKPLVLPPLRFVVGADRGCAFTVDPPTAHALIAEVCASVAASGFRKVAIVNASPWNEELCSAAARDLRVSRGIHMFHVHLSALDLDLHPARSRSRRRLQTLLTFLRDTEPAPPGPAGAGAAAGWGLEPVTELAPPASSLKEARSEGPAILSSAATRLSKLLADIRDRPPLSAKLMPP